ncbi:hypothetical protein [Mycoplasma mycoides]|uniref:Uncharacterized protein n=2 Tax=Mycoplasma mycoides TaxID=2102 RepID=A0AAE2JTI8_MYCMY|nr:hypothetical protein [Mycoplasma mycoides]KJQ46413.1 hypothetical protein TS59_0666 [Mycoplasma mycoides subsp. mycoides]KJQ47139.1 hypothetical protein TS60_0684 [Mycoplasma mycoides subsp. mycoides]
MKPDAQNRTDSNKSSDDQQQQQQKEKTKTKEENKKDLKHSEDTKEPWYKRSWNKIKEGWSWLKSKVSKK